ncbi:single-stranded DNA exonuclease [Acidianus ambivalens]|uniref:Single-stranded DNA exonuclease n=1 Tax=Acidianus ambivalens TaxID=2283 RepID=A0A650CSF9_ACIAM|nr:single-stranded DNA exonuclease [Acidianus ambivalens]MQL55215.1 single-stranded DNA exonuclease [Acidianus ambivalens]QGR20760.1 single-stranded DNA exonuclease [Acidianus ambivalens]
MENFIKEPTPEEAKKLIESINKEESLCIRIPYNVDAILAASLIIKYMESPSAISFSSSNCELEFSEKEEGKFVRFKNTQVFIGNSSFSSIIPITTEDILPILTGISSSVVLERRNFSDWELSIMKNSENLGITIEKNLKIPSYHDAPIFLSLIESFDPYIPTVTGSRENAIALINEIGIDELSKLTELNEGALNTLIFKIVSLIMKINPKVTRDDIITDRIFYLNYDSLELAFSFIYFLDTIGSKILVDFALNQSIARILINKFREIIGKGFSIGSITEDKKFFIVDSNLKSPTLLQLILLQTQKVRKDKPIVIKDGNKLLTSRYFINTEKEGLIEVEGRD